MVLDDPSPEVRFWCAFALGQIGARSALPALRQLVASDEAVVLGWWSVGTEMADGMRTVHAHCLGFIGRTFGFSPILIALN